MFKKIMNSTLFQYENRECPVFSIKFGNAQIDYLNYLKTMF